MHRMTSTLNTHSHCQWKLLQAWALAPKVRDERKIAEEFRIVWSNIHAKFLDKIHNIGGIFRHRVGTGRLEINWIANKLNFQVLPGMVSAWKLRINQFQYFPAVSRAFLMAHRTLYSLTYCTVLQQHRSLFEHRIRAWGELRRKHHWIFCRWCSSKLWKWVEFLGVHVGAYRRQHSGKFHSTLKALK